jgi:hypothetical protein
MDAVVTSVAGGQPLFLNSLRQIRSWISLSHLLPTVSTHQISLLNLLFTTELIAMNLNGLCLVVCLSGVHLDQVHKKALSDLSLSL